MKFTWIYILSFAVVAVSCAPDRGAENPSNAGDVSGARKDAEEERAETLEDLVDLGAAENDLPILPPIILIDFTNGTNLTSEEKAKRTINGNLGYGFQPNNLFTGKYNYYFPAGKTGTTVSIEESISPFLPTTIVEKENPAPQSRPYEFGQRIQLQKTAPSNGNNFQSYSRPPAPQTENYASYSTQKPPLDLRSNRFPAGLGSYKNLGQIYQQSYSTPSPPLRLNDPAPFQQQYQPPSSGLTNAFNSQVQNYESLSTTGLPPVYNQPGFPRRYELSSYSTSAPPVQPSRSRTTVLSPVNDAPKYSYENGIKYEHKIVWRYPNGMVSDIAPNSHPGYPTLAKAAPTQNYQAQGAGYSVNSNAEGIYSQKPATFPQDTSSNENEDAGSKPSQFVSSASISTDAGGYAAVTPAPPARKYTLQNFYPVGGLGGQFSRSQALSGPVGSTFDSPKTLTNYPIDSPEAEFSGIRGFPAREIFGEGNGYADSASRTSNYERPENSGSDPSSGSSRPNLQLSKYSPQVQQYLKKALGLGETRGDKIQAHNGASANDDFRYSSLLDYNPSISQYIGNPSSILNAQPTFIQAGSSLIPVIILRVDGAPPIQPKLTPNINLKALLQKYLTQYAQTVSSLTQGKDGSVRDYGSARAEASASSADLGQFDLGELTRGLGQFGSPGPSFKQNFAQNFAQSIARSTHSYQPGSFPGQVSYEATEALLGRANADYASPTAGEITARKSKVKSVQIIEDPRFTSYKAKN